MRRSLLFILVPTILLSTTTLLAQSQRPAANAPAANAPAANTPAANASAANAASAPAASALAASAPAANTPAANTPAASASATNAATPSGHHAPRPADRFAGLDTAFARVLKDWHAAGFAVAVVEKGSLIYAKGFGYKDLAHKSPVTPHTLFAIGSCTKAFTASIIGLLQKQGLVDIDKPVREYLPALRFYNTTMDNMITLRDMMCHRTGLPRYDLSWYALPPASRDSVLRRVQYMEPSFAPRERWQYNNFMFLGQGLVAEKLTGQSWEKNVADRILTPLGMTGTNFSIASLQQSGDYSLGYDVKKDSLIKSIAYHDLTEMGPAGSINSNVLDMSAWVRTWIHGGKFKGREVLPESYVDEATSAQMVLGGGRPGKDQPDIYFSCYGFGWFLASYRGHYRVEHGGNIDGFSASTCFFPTDSIGIIVLSNQNSSQVPPIIRNLLADRLLHLPYKDWDTDLKRTADAARKEEKSASAARLSNQLPGTHPSHALSDYAGLFSNLAYGNFEILLKDDSLIAVLPRQKWWLKHFHYDVFEPLEIDTRDGIDTSDRSNNRLSFAMDEVGSIATVSMRLDAAFDKPVVFTRTPRPRTLSIEQLNKYVGEYVLGASLTVKIYIQDSALHLSAPGQGDYELAAVDLDKFALKTLTGFYVQFQLDDGGVVTGLMSIQPNGNFKATKKK